MNPSHCAVFWHSFLCTPNLPKYSFVLFSLPKFCMCLSHFTCMLQAPPISPSLLWSLPYSSVKGTKYEVPRSTSPCSPVILTPSDDQFFSQTFLFVLTGKLDEAVTFSARRSVWLFVSTAIIFTGFSLFFTFPLDSASNYATVASFPVLPSSLFPHPPPPPFDTMDLKFEMLTA
jgi:hypothetical protein